MSHRIGLDGGSGGRDASGARAVPVDRCPLHISSTQPCKSQVLCATSTPGVDAIGWMNVRYRPAARRTKVYRGRDASRRFERRIRCWYGDVVNAISIERLERWMSGTTIAVWQFKVRQQESSERERKRSVRQQLVSTDFSISFTVSETSQVRTVISSIYELISCGIILAKRGLR